MGEISLPPNYSTTTAPLPSFTSLDSSSELDEKMEELSNKKLAILSLSLSFLVEREKFPPFSLVESPYIFVVNGVMFNARDSFTLWIRGAKRPSDPEKKVRHSHIIIIISKLAAEEPSGVLGSLANPYLVSVAGKVNPNSCWFKNLFK